MDWDRVRQVVEAATAAMRAMEYEPSPGFKTLWPSMWCEWGSIAISEALDASGLGPWIFVQAGLPDDMSGHAWLEHVDENGEVDFTIDSTLHQFHRHPEPYIGPGRTPAASEFTDLKFRGPWREWPVLRHNRTYKEFADATLAEMGLAGPE